MLPVFVNMMHMFGRRKYSTFECYKAVTLQELCDGDTKQRSCTSISSPHIYNCAKVSKRINKAIVGYFQDYFVLQHSSRVLSDLHGEQKPQNQKFRECVSSKTLPVRFI